MQSMDGHGRRIGLALELKVGRLRDDNAVVDADDIRAEQQQG